jgi:hypothetical protein
MDDIPNFAAWSNANLAQFAKDAYVRMQQQEEAIAQCQCDLKDAMKVIRLHIQEKDRHDR